MSDETWLRGTIEEHERGLVAYALRLVGDLDRARDAVQETFLRLLEADRAAVQPHVVPWLFGVCRTRALDLLAKETPMRTTDSERLLERRDPGPGPDRAALLDEDRSTLARLVRDLPADQREALQLKFASGLSYREIAAVMEHPIGQVSWLIHRGIAALRERMASEIRTESLEGQA